MFEHGGVKRKGGREGEREEVLAGPREEKGRERRGKRMFELGRGKAPRNSGTQLIFQKSAFAPNSLWERKTGHERAKVAEDEWWVMDSGFKKGHK